VKNGTLAFYCETLAANTLKTFLVNKKKKKKEYINFWTTPFKHIRNKNHLISHNVQTILPYMDTSENSFRFAVTAN